jgi:hypothetical protein
MKYSYTLKIETELESEVESEVGLIRRIVDELIKKIDEEKTEVSVKEVWDNRPIKFRLVEIK